MRALFSGSSYSQAQKCPGSVVLPQVGADVPAAASGSAQHQHFAERAQLGVERAFERLDLVAQAWDLSEDSAAIFAALCRRFTWVPPEGAVVELPLGLYADGRVRRVVGGRGSYEGPDGLLFPGTLDVMWAEPDPLVIDASGAPRCPESSVL